MRRREFIAVMGGAVVAWPLAARAQQGERVRHIDILMNADSPDLRSQHEAFLQFLTQLGWIDGRNVQIDTRWSKGPADIRRPKGPWKSNRQIAETKWVHECPPARARRAAMLATRRQSAQ